MADGRLRAHNDRRQHLRRKILLPIYLPARRWSFHIRPGAYVQLAEAASGVRHAMPNLRNCLPGERDQAKRGDRYERMLLLPRLSGHLLRRPDLPTDGCSAETSSRKAISDGQDGGPLDRNAVFGEGTLNALAQRTKSTTG